MTKITHRDIMIRRNVSYDTPKSAPHTIMTQQQQQQHRQHHEGSEASSSSSIIRAAHYPPPPSFMTTSWLTPGSALLLSSLPIGLGAYIGYRRTLHESASSSSSLTTPKKNIIPRVVGVNNVMTTTTIHTTPPPAVLAARALIIGTLLSISGTALLLSSIFLISGCSSVDELIHACKIWGPKKLQNFENRLEHYMGLQLGSGGSKARALVQLQYKQEILGMTEEEELEYIANKYKGELFNENTNSGRS